MRFLDAQLRPIALADALPPLVTALAVTGMTALMSVLSGHDAGFALKLFPAVFVGALLAQAGVSPARTPLAMVASLPLIGLMLAGSAQLAEMLPV